MKVEAAILVADILPLSLGIGRKLRWESASLHTWKGTVGPYLC